MPDALPPGFDEPRVLREDPRRVLAAVDRTTHRPVLLKEARTRQAAIREARLLRRVRSPFTAEFLRLARTGSTFWIATVWVDGKPLGRDACNAGGEPAGAWPADLLRILCHLHRRGVVHGDLKPGNILRRPDGTLCLVDFDFASRAGEEATFEEAGGTIGFVAPERLSGWPADPRSDLYSVAATFRALGMTHGTFQPLLAGLAAPTPGARPAHTDAVLAAMAALTGPGHVPAPDLAWAGWQEGAITRDRLAVGLSAHLGCDRTISTLLARELQEASAGRREVAQELWREWLPQVTADPWGPTSAEVWRNAVPALRDLARAAARVAYARVSPEARRYGALAAQLGQRFMRPELDEVTAHARRAGVEIGSTPGDENEAMLIDELLDHHLLAEEREPDGPASLRFATSYAWNVACEALGPEAARLINRELAAAAARALESAESPPRTEELARAAGFHAAAGERERAWELYWCAANVAYDRGQYGNAASYFDDGWRAQVGTPAGNTLAPPASAEALLPLGMADRLGSIARYANALGARGRHADAQAWIDRGIKLATSPRDRAGMKRVHAVILWRERRYEAALGKAREGLELAGGDREVSGLLRHVEALALHDLKRPDAEDAARQALVLLEAAGDFHSLVAILNLLGAMAYGRNDLAAAQSMWQRSLELAANSGYRESETSAHANLGAVANRRGDMEGFFDHLTAARRIAAENRLDDSAWACSANLGVWCQSKEDWDGAVRYWKEALDMAIDSGQVGRALHAQSAIGRLETQAGRIAAAERTLREAMLLGDTQHAAAGDLLRVLLRLMELPVWIRRLPVEEGLLEQAQSLAAGREDPRERSELAIIGAASFLLSGGAPDEAERRLGPLPLQSDLQGWHHLVRARARAAAGDEAGAAAAHEAALAAFAQHHPNSYHRAFALFERACQLAAGYPAAAMPLLEECVSLARAARTRWIEASALALRARMRAASEPRRSIQSKGGAP